MCLRSSAAWDCSIIGLLTYRTISWSTRLQSALRAESRCSGSGSASQPSSQFYSSTRLHCLKPTLTAHTCHLTLEVEHIISLEDHIRWRVITSAGALSERERDFSSVRLVWVSSAALSSSCSSSDAVFWSLCFSNFLSEHICVPALHRCFLAHFVHVRIWWIKFAGIFFPRCRISLSQVINEFSWLYRLFAKVGTSTHTELCSILGRFASFPPLPLTLITQADSSHADLSYFSATLLWWWWPPLTEHLKSMKMAMAMLLLLLHLLAYGRTI